MAKNKTAGSENAAPEAAPEKPVLKSVQFTQPEKGKHIYKSVDPVGYEVFLNRDKKSWTTTSPNGMLSETSANRAQAFTVATDDAFPEQKAAKDAAKEKAQTVPKVNDIEHKVLDVLQEQSGPVDQGVISTATEIGLDKLIGVLARLVQRKCVSIEPGGLAITDRGREANSKWSPQQPKEPKQPREKKPKTVKTPEEIEANWRNRMEAKYGPAPEGVGPRPNKLQVQEARINLAKAALALQEMDLNLHPYSHVAQAKIVKARDRVTLEQEKYEKIKNAPVEEQEAEASSADPS